MKLRTIVPTTLLLAASAFAATSALRQMPMVKPGPEHDVLKHMAGMWDAEVKFGEFPPSKGTMDAKLDLGGLWIVSDFKGEMGPGMTFTGHEVFGWDSAKKKYVGCWVDSMSTNMSISEGTWDAATKTMTSTGQGVDMSGQPATMTQVVKVEDADHHTFTMHMGGADTPALMTIKYTRKK